MVCYGVSEGIEIKMRGLIGEGQNPSSKNQNRADKIEKSCGKKRRKLESHPMKKSKKEADPSAYPLPTKGLKIKSL